MTAARGRHQSSQVARSRFNCCRLLPLRKHECAHKNLLQAHALGDWVQVISLRSFYGLVTALAAALMPKSRLSCGNVLSSASIGPCRHSGADPGADNFSAAANQFGPDYGHCPGEEAAAGSHAKASPIARATPRTPATIHHVERGWPSWLDGLSEVRTILQCNVTLCSNGFFLKCCFHNGHWVTMHTLSVPSVGAFFSSAGIQQHLSAGARPFDPALVNTTLSLLTHI